MNIELLRILLPLFLELVNKFHRDNDRIPTLEEAEQLLEDDLTKFIMIGDKWLADHPQRELEKSFLLNTEKNS